MTSTRNALGAALLLTTLSVGLGEASFVLFLTGLTRTMSAFG
jgi:hypothetical protein